jgi:glycosyltransferase involved in cell wall biosynthesis
MARALIRLGHRVTVIAPRYEGAQDHLEPFEVLRSFEHQKLDLSSLAAIRKALAPVRSDDIVLAADIRAGIATSIVRLGRKFEKIIMFHGGEIKRAGYSRFASLSNRLSAAFARKRVANSSYTAELVRAYLGCQTEVTLLGVSPYWFDAASQPFENQQLNEIPATIPIVCTVARLESRKGHLVAMQALRQMAERSDIDFRYVICGKAVYPDYSEKVLAEVAAFPKRFLYVGPLSKDDVRRLYARASVMVLAAQDEPGFIEGFGLVITEAGAQKCPSVATRVGGIVDAVLDGKTGLLCDPEDVGGISASIERLLQDQHLRQKLGASAHDYAASLTWEETARRTLAM